VINDKDECFSLIRSYRIYIANAIASFISISHFHKFLSPIIVSFVSTIATVFLPDAVSLCIYVLDVIARLVEA
jgi:hypothetical protein